MNNQIILERSLAQNFASEWKLISTKAPTKSLFQIFWRGANSELSGILKIYGSLNTQAATLIDEIKIDCPTNLANTKSILIEAPYQFFKFVYEAAGELSSGNINIIGAALL